MTAMRKFMFVILATPFLVFSTLLMTPAVASACSLSGSGFLGLPTWYKYMQGEDIAGRCTPTFNQDAGSILLIGVALIDILMHLIGVIAVGYVIYGSFKYITSQGQPDSTNAARQTIINAMVGIAISLVSIPIVSYLGKSVLSK